MQIKKVIKGDEARSSLYKGFELVSDVVAATAGPSGRNVAIQSEWGAPKVTKDGVTVAKSVNIGGIEGESAVIAGAVNGDIDVKGPVIVDSTAVIMGNIKSRSVQINNGAVIEGFCSQSYSDIDVKSFFA